MSVSVNKSSNLNKKAVELAKPVPGSRIRREPVPSVEQQRTSLIGRIEWDSREWEIRLATGGIIFFALAIAAVVIDLGELLSH